ncbi:MAG: hypothetical protein DRO12_05515 [Thermoprotei archaeon]|nr:MAG: hypothetical protein DRO12_05515 [Thermoprotei archaeon]
MGRFKVLFGFWLIGYAIGFLGYFLFKHTAILNYLYQALLMLIGNNEIVMASLTGLATSFITLAIVVAWSYSSNP